MGKCYNSTIINAPIDKVWSTVENFHEMGWAAKTVEKTEIVGEQKGTQLGARRVLNGVFHETLIGLDQNEHIIKYRITDAPGTPLEKGKIDSYIGRVRLLPVTDASKTFVEWISEYSGADSEAAVGDFCNPIYRSLLSDLVNHFA